MPTTPRIRLHRAVWVVGWLVAALGLLSVPATVRAAPADTATPTPLVVQLTSLRPLAPQPHQLLALTGTVRNTSTTTVSTLGLQLRYRQQRIGSRSEFDAYAANQPDNSPLPLPDDVVGAAQTSLGASSLAPGASTSFRISVNTDALSLTIPWQVYELGVQINGATPQRFGAVGGLRTFLPWAPLGVPGVGLPTQVAWVWPLIDQPHRSVGDTWLNDDLAAALSPTGRLGRLVAAGITAENLRPAARARGGKAATTVRATPVPVTWAVDPMLVEDAQLMAAGYKVGAGHGAVTGRGAQAAKTWLSQLQTAIPKGELLAVPYADPDVVAAVRGGLASSVQVAVNQGQTLLANALNVEPETYAWPPGGALDQRSLDTLFTAGVSTVVLDNSALPYANGDPNVTPSAHTTVQARDGALGALLIDSGLQQLVHSATTNRAGQESALQQFLAETLMIQAELPSDQRAIVVAPDRRWAPSRVFAQDLVVDTGLVPWIQPVSLSTALANPPTPNVPRLGLTYHGRNSELSLIAVEDTRAIKARADSFAAILAAGDPQARTFDDAVLRTLSSAYRTDAVDGARLRAAVADSLRTTMGRVRIAARSGSFVTLTSHSGTVPITVANELDTPVRVVVAISSQHLELSGNGRAVQTIPAHRQVSVDVRAQARTSGVFPLTVTLYTPTGQAYDAEQLFVRSTAYGTVAILITAGALGVLLIAVVIRLIRRASAARRAAAAA